jgi:mono/diheme cytochrome c family protein
VLALLVLPGLESAAGQAKAPQLPEAAGREVVKKVCANCHEIETVIASRRTRIGWERSVEDMIARGAKGSDDELDAVVEYLATLFRKNKCECGVNRRVGEIARPFREGSTGDCGISSTERQDQRF